MPRIQSFRCALMLLLSSTAAICPLPTAPPDASSAAASASERSELAPGRYAGFSGYQRAITCDSPEAQQWFNQGIQLLYGFNHDEAIRSFEQAAEIDPSCGMAWWGIAYARGLHINNPQMSRAARLDATRLSRARSAADGKGSIR